MKKGKLVLVILAIMLVFAMVSCGPPEEQTPQQKWAKYVGNYKADYKLGGNVNNEFIDLTNDEILLNDKTKTNPTDYIYFKITKWEDESSGITIPSWTSASVAEYSKPDKFNKVFKLTGKITGAKPVNTSPKSLFGSKTAPGFDDDDITNETECWIFLYFGPDHTATECNSFVRSAFSKAEANNGPNPVDGNENPTEIRYYRDQNM